MNRRKKYRLFIICCLTLDLLVMLLLGYQYLKRKIPDEIQISRDRGENARDVTEALSAPLVKFEEAVTVSRDGGYILPCKLLGYIPFKEIKVTPVDKQEIYVSGSTVGIYMETEGVLVIDTGEIQDQNGETKEPAKNIIKQGDYIVSFNGQKISTKKELINDIANLDGDTVTLEVSREGESVPVSVTPVKDTKGDYKLGIWVKDNAQGLGTITFLNADSRFGALGHGIHDVDTNTLLEIDNGTVYETSIKDIKKGENGTPGGMEGIIVYNNYNVLGTITENTDCGIFGTIDRIDSLFTDLKPMETASKEEIEVGPAVIRCAVEGEVKDYEIRITKIDKGTQEINKGIVIEVTDEKLLEITGGIVQGMSGSPIIQNGKLVGAVTHVFVQDATKGYGVFIENMLKNVK